MKLEVEHIGLAARDPVALKDWYVQVLQADVVFQMPQTPPAFLLQLHGLLVEIYPARSETAFTRDNGVAGWRHLAFKVDSLDEARQWLADRGVQFNEAVKPAGGGGKVIFFQDPEGNLFHLVERLPGGYQ